MVSCITFVQHPDCELKNSQLPVKSHLEALTKINSHNSFGLSSWCSAPQEDSTQAYSELLQSCDSVTSVKQAEAIKSEFYVIFNNKVNAFLAGANDGQHIWVSTLGYCL